MSGAYTAIDLSKLPAPTIVEPLEFDQLVLEILADLIARDPVFEGLVPTDPMYKLIEVVAFRELLLRQRVNEAAKGVMLSYAQGSDLDQIAARYGVQRIEFSADDYSRIDAELRELVVAAMQNLPNITVTAGVNAANTTITGVTGRSVHEDIVLPVIRTLQKSKAELVPQTYITYRAVRGATNPGKLYCLLTKAQAQAELAQLQAIWAEAQDLANDKYQDAITDANDTYATDVAAIDALKLARIDEILEDDHLTSVNASAERISFFNLAPGDENPVRRLALNGGQLRWEARRLQRQKDDYDAGELITPFAWRRPLMDDASYESMGINYSAAVDNDEETAFLNDWALTKAAYDTAVAEAEVEFAPDYAQAIVDRDAAIAAASLLIPEDTFDFADDLLEDATLQEFVEWNANIDEFVASDLLVARWMPEAIERLISTLSFYERRLLDHCQTIRKLDTEHVAGHRIIQTTRTQVLADLAVLPPAPANFEPDEDLRRRAQLALEGFSTAGPVGAYIFHALGADSRVRDVSVQSPEPGEVLVTILSREDDGTATADLLAAVETVITNDDIRPLTDLVTVQGAEIVNYAVDAELTVYPGPDSATILDAAEVALRDYCEQNHRLGRSITMSGLYGVLHREGVANVTIHNPVQSVIVTKSQAPYALSLAVRIGGVND